METNTTVTPIPQAWEQARQTKLGLATITLTPEGDLVEATVTISRGITIFTAEGTFSTRREAFFWAYGVKQSINDDYAGYQYSNGMLVETKPKKGQIATVLDAEKELLTVSQNYENFSLSSPTSQKERGITEKDVRGSALSAEEQEKLLELMKKAKGQVNHA